MQDMTRKCTHIYYEWTYFTHERRLNIKYTQDLSCFRFKYRYVYLKQIYLHFLYAFYLRFYTLYNVSISELGIDENEMQDIYFIPMSEYSVDTFVYLVVIFFSIKPRNVLKINIYDLK